MYLIRIHTVTFLPFRAYNTDNQLIIHSAFKATIQCIIEEFFLTNPDILLYQCETGDSRQAMRARLFTRWFNEFDKRDRFCVKVSILRDEEVDNYIAIIVQKSNPKLNDILRDFDEFIGFFDTKPE